MGGWVENVVGLKGESLVAGPTGKDLKVVVVLWSFDESVVRSLW